MKRIEDRVYIQRHDIMHVLVLARDSHVGFRLARNALRPKREKALQLSRRHRPLWREAPGGPGQQDRGERLPRVAVHGTYRRAGKAADALRDHADHAGVVGVVDVGVGARRGVGGRSEGGGVHQLLV